MLINLSLFVLIRDAIASLYREQKTVTAGKFKAVISGCKVNLYRSSTFLTSWTAETPEDAFQQAILEVRYLAKEVMGDGENF